MTPLQTPSGETEPPIDAEQPETPKAQPPTRAGIRLGRFDGLEHHELITLLDEINTEQARARFREAIYLAIIFWLIFGLSVVYAPRYFWHPPHIITAPEDKRNTMTYLDTPPDLKSLLKRTTPAPNISQRSTEAQSPKPSPQAPEPKAGNPAPAPRPTPQQQQPQPQPQGAAPQPQQQPQQQQPQQQARNTPPTPAPPQPRNQPLADAPAPSANRSIFGGQQSAGDAVREAARGSRSNGGDVGEYGSTGRGANGGMKQGVQVLSDTQGVDFGKYLQRLLSDVRRNWLPLIPEECRPPLNKQGITGVRFTILPDGKIAAMNLDYSTHDQAIDRAAWGSITGLGQAQPLPKEFHGPNLELRIEFRINKDIPEAQ